MKIVGTQGTIPTSAIASYVLTKTSAADMKATMMSEVRLIDADALRKAVNDFYDNHFKGLVPNELITYAEAVDNAIDNALTVEPEVYMTAKDYNLYLEGYKQGKKDFARQQGEWIDHKCHIECNQCRVWFLKDHLIRKSFCPNCGADMRGAEE